MLPRTNREGGPKTTLVLQQKANKKRSVGETRERISTLTMSLDTQSMDMHPMASGDKRKATDDEDDFSDMAVITGNSVDAAKEAQKLEEQAAATASCVRRVARLMTAAREATVVCGKERYMVVMTIADATAAMKDTAAIHNAGAWADKIVYKRTGLRLSKYDDKVSYLNRSISVDIMFKEVGKTVSATFARLFPNVVQSTANLFNPTFNQDNTGSTDIFATKTEQANICVSDEQIEIILHRMLDEKKAPFGTGCKMLTCIKNALTVVSKSKAGQEALVKRYNKQTRMDNDAAGVAYEKKKAQNDLMKKTTPPPQSKKQSIEAVEGKYVKLTLTIAHIEEMIVTALMYSIKTAAHIRYKITYTDMEKVGGNDLSEYEETPEKLVFADVRKPRKNKAPKLAAPPPLVGKVAEVKEEKV
jgi:hypothetical protein